MSKFITFISVCDCHNYSVNNVMCLCSQESTTVLICFSSSLPSLCLSLSSLYIDEQKPKWFLQNCCSWWVKSKVVVYYTVILSIEASPMGLWHNLNRFLVSCWNSKWLVYLVTHLLIVICGEIPLTIHRSRIDLVYFKSIKNTKNRV